VQLLHPDPCPHQAPPLDRGLRVDQVVLFLDLSDVKDELFYEEDAAGRAKLIPYGPFASASGWGTRVEEWSEFSENVVEPNFVVLGALSRNLKLLVRKMTRKELGRRGLFTNQAPPPLDPRLGGV
jgi:hypothetical protein